MTEFLNKKPAFKTDFSESRNGSSSALTSTCIIANQGIIGNQKTAEDTAVLEESNLTYDPGLSTYSNYSKASSFVNSYSVNNQKTVEVEGIEPSDPWLIIQGRRQVTPTASLLYQKIKVYEI